MLVSVFFPPFFFFFFFSSFPLTRLVLIRCDTTVFDDSSNFIIYGTLLGVKGEDFMFTFLRVEHLHLLFFPLFDCSG